MENKITPAQHTEMPDLEVLFDLADLFKVFGDSTRIRIMFTISDNEMSVLSIAEALNMEQSTISHQLRVLRQNKLVRVRREGKQIYEGALASLKRFKDDVKEVKSGYECGLVFEKFNDIQEMDIVEAYIMVEVPR